MRPTTFPSPSPSSANSETVRCRLANDPSLLWSLIKNARQHTRGIRVKTAVRVTQVTRVTHPVCDKINGRSFQAYSELTLHQLSTMVLNVRLMRGCVTPLRFGMLCCQCCCVDPAMMRTSPAESVALIFLLRSRLCRRTKSRAAPKDTDAMVGLGPYLQPWQQGVCVCVCVLAGCRQGLHPATCWHM